MAITNLIIKNKIHVAEHFPLASVPASGRSQSTSAAAPIFGKDDEPPVSGADEASALDQAAREGLLEHFSSAAADPNHQVFEHFLAGNLKHKRVFEHFLAASSHGAAVFEHFPGGSPKWKILEHFSLVNAALFGIGKEAGGSHPDEHFTYTLPNPQMVRSIKVTRLDDGSYLLELKD